MFQMNEEKNLNINCHCVLLNKANDSKVLLYALHEHDVFLYGSADEAIKFLHLEDQHSEL